MPDRTLGNADNVNITNNTVINGHVTATSLWVGFNDVIDNNVFVTAGSEVAHFAHPDGYLGGTGMDGEGA